MDRDLVVDLRRTLHGCSAEFASKVMDRINRLATWIAPSTEMGTGMLLFRTLTEREYMINLSAIPAATVESWRKTTSVSR